MTNERGIIYAWACDNGLVKVGFSTNPQVRFRSYNSFGSVQHLYMSQLTDDPRSAEKRCHMELSAFRESGEWYRAPYEKVKQVIMRVVPGVGTEINGKREIYDYFGYWGSCEDDSFRKDAGNTLIEAMKEMTKEEIIERFASLLGVKP